MTAVVTFTNPLALFVFDFNATQQAVVNESNVSMELSWDGLTVHAVMPASGPSSAISWEDHARDRVWLRRVGAGGGAKMVSVLASTR